MNSFILCHQFFSNESSVAVLDDSGSLSWHDFELMQDFGVNFANSFQFGQLGVWMGIVLFSTNSRLIQKPTLDKQLFVAQMEGTVPTFGFTCIPCGIEEAYKSLARQDSDVKLLTIHAMMTTNAPWTVV